MSGETWQLGPLKVGPGQALRGVFQVDIGAMKVDFPIALINGTEPDPVVLVTSGMDGSEYAAVEAALRLIDALDATRLAGRVMICPILDPLSFEAQQSQNPLDGLCLRHVFPGDLEGKPTQRLGYFIYQNFITAADAWLDLHAVDTADDAMPFVWAARGDDAQFNEQCTLLLRHSGAEVGLHRPPYTWDPALHALTASTPLLVSQAGRAYQSDEAATEFHLHVIQSIMHGMDILPLENRPGTPAIFLDTAPALAEFTGLWYPRIKAGEGVSSGQVLGEIFKLDGSAALQEVRSPADGTAVIVRDGLAVRPRMRLALIAHRPQQGNGDPGT